MRARRALLSLPMLVALCPGASALEKTSHGQRAYRGELAGEAVVANGLVRVPAKRFSYASCHGPDALGGREGGTVAPPIRWDILSSAIAVRPGYDRASFARALAEGTGPAGRALLQAMPRYALEPSTVAALASYLDAPALARPAGLDPRRLKIAASGNTSLDRGAADVLAEDGAAVYGRRLELVADEPSAFSLRELEEITYDPDVVSYQDLLDHFWVNIDPFDARGQFCDKGPSYLSAIFVADEQERLLAEQSKRRVAERFPDEEIVTPILTAATFHPIEGDEIHHQDFYKKSPVRYKAYRWSCGRDKRLKEIWGDNATV